MRSLEDAEGFWFGFPAGLEPFVVETSLRSRPPYLGDCRNVDGPVEAAAASAYKR